MCAVWPILDTLIGWDFQRILVAGEGDTNGLVGAELGSNTARIGGWNIRGDSFLWVALVSLR